MVYLGCYLFMKFLRHQLENIAQIVAHSSMYKGEVGHLELKSRISLLPSYFI